MKAYVEPEWSTVDHMLDKLDLEEAKRESAKAKKRIFAANDDEDEEAAESEEDESDSNEAEDDSNNNGDESNEKMQQDDSNNANYEDESDYDDSLFCVACNKSFKSAKSFENHEKSKKHKDNVDLLKRHMNEDEANLFEGKGEKNSDEEEEEEEACVAKSSSNQDNTKQKLAFLKFKYVCAFCVKYYLFILQDCLRSKRRSDVRTETIIWTMRAARTMRRTMRKRGRRLRLTSQKMWKMRNKLPKR
jgi:hypothetical protein